ncbi:MAG: pseudouridine synthase [Pirellulaceae bacterium]
MSRRKHAPRNESTADESTSDRGERLQKVLAAAGVGSRRECEELIVEGRIEVDSEVVRELGVRVDPSRQRIRVDGVSLHRPKRVYYLVNKPPGVVCTNRDPSGRTRVVDLIRADERLFTVGRLDRTSEGLILVTNDGELANRLTHPRYGISKVYRVRVAGQPTSVILNKLRHGIHLADSFARVVGARVKRRFRQSTELEITLTEGRNREIRRLLARVGHKVLSLKRIAIGPLRLGELPLGGYRRLTRDEVRQLEHVSRRREKVSAAPKKQRVPSVRARGKSRDTKSAAPKKSRPQADKRSRSRKRKR